ncbi:MAG: hypothetical protein KA159_05815 [Halioglobus sp.]|nr:hypothetical protein [Halioglobus sp.]
MNTPWQVQLSRSARVRVQLLPLLLTALLAGCSDGANNDRREPPEPNEPVVIVDPDFPDYTLVELTAGDDLEARALEALIEAEPKTVIRFPAGVYDFTSELSSSVDNIVIKGAGMASEGGTVLRFDKQTSGAQGVFATGKILLSRISRLKIRPGTLSR